MIFLLEFLPKTEQDFCIQIKCAKDKFANKKN